jgi:hypothetical protein
MTVRRGHAALTLLTAVAALVGCVAFVDPLGPGRLFAGLATGASFAEAPVVAESALADHAEVIRAQLDTFTVDPEARPPLVRAAVVADTHAVRVLELAPGAAADTGKLRRIRAEADTIRRIVTDSIKKRPVYSKLTVYAKRALDSVMVRAARIDSIATALLAAAPPPPPPDTTPPPPPPDTTAPPPLPPTAVCGSLIGWPIPSVATQTALGPPWSDYETKIGTRLDSQWEQYKGNTANLWEVINYYDRAAIEYVWWCRTGDVKHRERARTIAVDYREKFYQPARTDGFAYNTSTFWSMPLGVALHYLDTGDERSRRAVGYSAEWLMNVVYYNDLARTTTIPKPATATESPAGAALPATLAVGVAENRIRARVLEAAVIAHALNAPTGGPGSQQVNTIPGTWAEKATAIVEQIVKAQGADGAFRDVTSGGAAKPFMDGLLNTALILYYQLVTPDPRIVTLIRRQLDYSYTNVWLGTSFAYYEWAYTDPSNPDWSGGRYPAPDLNLLMIHGFAFVCERTGVTSYCDKGRTVFAGGVAGAYLDSPKHLNQNALSAPRAFGVLSGPR